MTYNSEHKVDSFVTMDVLYISILACLTLLIANRVFQEAAHFVLPSKRCCYCNSEALT